MLKGIIVGLLFSFACIASGAWGDAKDLNLVYIDGYHALPMERIPEVLNVASHYFKEVGVVFRIKVLTESDPCPALHNLATRDEEISCFSKDARTSGYTRKKKLTYYVLPPYYEDNDFWIAGMTEWIGGKVAIGNAEEINQDGVSRITESGVILAHETYHMLGATHAKAISLMHPNALAYVHQGEWLPVLRSSKRQVRRFLIKEK